MRNEPGTHGLIDARSNTPIDSGPICKKQERSLEAFGNLAFGGLGVIVGLSICGFIYLIVTRMILSGTQPVAGVLFALFLIFAGLSLAYVFRNEDK